MQTTLTIDPDVEVLLKEAVSTQRKTLDEVANDALRRALAGERARQRKPYVLQPRHLGIRAEVDADKASRLSEELEDQEIIRKLHEGR
jgi:hypothetical protein